jgi:hypothetical protein
MTNKEIGPKPPKRESAMEWLKNVRAMGHGGQFDKDYKRRIHHGWFRRAAFFETAMEMGLELTDAEKDYLNNNRGGGKEEFGAEEKKEKPKESTYEKRHNKVTSRRFANKRKTTIAEDGLWVYQNMMNMKVLATDAPSMGAYAMLLWARKNPDDFYRSAVMKQMAEGAIESAKYKDDGEDLEKLNKLLGKLENAEGARGKPEAKKAADSPRAKRRRA